MIIPVTLSDHTISWRFNDSIAFDDWISMRLWQRDGGIAVIRLSGLVAADSFETSLRQAVYGYDCGSSHVQFYRIQGDQLQQGLMTAFQNLFNIHHIHNTQEIIDEILKHLDSEAPVVYLQPSDNPTIDLLQEAEELSERITKSPSRYGLTLILTQSPHLSLLTSRGYDFLQGYPTESILDIQNVELSNVWRTYLHYRIAWECAGNIDDAQHLSQKAEIVPQYEDDTFETLLNDWAKSQFDLIGEDDKKNLSDWLNESLSQHDSKNSSHFSRILNSGFVWRFYGRNLYFVSPWVARAILLKNNNPDSKWFLHTSLVCAPIAQEILSVCHALDACIRYGHLSNVKKHPEGPSEDAKKLFETLRNSNNMIDFPINLRPKDPEDVWRFISTGEFLNKLYWNDKSIKVDYYHRLRELRNALAHGHYVRWRHITEILELQERISV